MQAIENSPVHGTAIAVGGQGFLILGPSGSGKSGLALQMIALGAELVSDDQTVLDKQGNRIILSAPSPLIGKIEARHLGIINVTPVQNATLSYVVDLVADTPARLPQRLTCDVMGLPIALLRGRNVPNLASALCVLGRNALDEQEAK